MATTSSRRDIVAPHIHDTACFVLAQNDPCTQTAKDLKAANPMNETRKGRIGRDIRPIAPTDLNKLTLPKSWLLTVLLCRDDDSAPLVAWVKQDPARVERIRFYHQESVEAGPLLKPWADSGLPFPRIDSFKTQRDLSARYGHDIVQRIVEDFGPSARQAPI